MRIPADEAGARGHSCRETRAGSFAYCASWASSATGRRRAREPSASAAALEELGTTFVKLGQLLSSRPDLLPDVYIEELGKLVDDVPPVPFAEIERGHRGGPRA